MSTEDEVREPHSTVSDTGDLPCTASSPAAVPATERVVFLDIARAFAMTRIVINHALPFAWIKWFEFLPIMFFASGALVARSLESRNWKQVFVGRLRRLALPLGVYLVFAASMWLFGLLPGTDTHLWYVWDYLAFTALSGVFLWLIRRNPWLFLALMAALATVTTFTGPPDASQGAAYMLVWVLGMMWTQRGFPSNAVLGITVVVGFAVSIGFVGTLIGFSPEVAPSDLGVAMAGLSLAWLAVFMLLRTQLEAAMRARVFGHVVRWMNRRMLTIYLWHVPAGVASRQWADDFGLSGAPWLIFVVVITLALTVLATMLLGGLEDNAKLSSARAKQRADSEVIVLD